MHFIKLTRGGKPIYVNVDQVVCFAPSGAGSRVVTTASIEKAEPYSSFLVAETPERLLELIEDE
jgi:hypothetical protein